MKRIDRMQHGAHASQGSGRQRREEQLGGRFVSRAFDFYASIRHSVDHSLLAINRRLREMIDRDAETLQWSVNADFRDATHVLQESFGDVPVVVDRDLR